MAEMTVKGFIIGRFLEMAQKELDAEAFAKLEEDIGVGYRKLKTAFFSDYPVTLQMDVEKKVARAVWDQTYEQAAYRIGRINFESFRDSAVGRTALALLGKDPRRVVLATVKLLSKVVNGLRVDAVEHGERRFAVRFRNSPHLTDGWKGTIEAAVEHAGATPRTTLTRHGDNDFEFTIEWN